MEQQQEVKIRLVLGALFGAFLAILFNVNDETRIVMVEFLKWFLVVELTGYTVTVLLIWVRSGVFKIRYLRLLYTWPAVLWAMRR